MTIPMLTPPLWGNVALVRSGVPFRDAHRRVGETLKLLESEGRTLADLTQDEWSGLGVDGSGPLDPDRSVRARSGVGGPSPQSVLAQADALELLLAARGTERK